MAFSKVTLNGDTLMDVTQKTVTAATMLSGTTALKNDGTDVTGNIPSKSSSDLTVSGATVTAPAGYYAASVSKSVASGSASTPATTITANPSMSAIINSGKNLFDMDCLLEADGWVEDNGDYYGQIRRVLEEYPVGTGVPIYGGLKENTQYTVSLTVRIDSEEGTNNGLTVVAYYSDGTHANVCGALRNQTTWTRISGTTTSGKTVTEICISYSNGGANVWHIKEAQIEEGATLTDYTPYAMQAVVNATVSASQSVTPTVSAGYVSTGTAGTVSVGGSGSETVLLSDLVSGTKSITASGTTDVTNYASASVAAGSATTPATSITANPTVSVTVGPGKNLLPYEIGDYASSASGLTFNILSDGGVHISGTSSAVSGYHCYSNTSTAMNLPVGSYRFLLTGSGTGFDNASIQLYTNTGSGMASRNYGKDFTYTITSSVTADYVRIRCAADTYDCTVYPMVMDSSNTDTTWEAYAIQAKATASVSASQSVTPTVSAGYVSTGTAGTVTVSGSSSNTEQLTTQSAQTIHPSTTDQTIASGTYLTGTQTIKAVTTTNLTAANIVSGVTVKIGDSTDDDCVASVTGTASSGYSETLMKNYIERASSFTDIDWPSGMTKIGSHAFAGCASFNPSSLPSGITSIAAYAFYDCTNLPLTSLPSGVTSIGAYAFSSCTNLALTSLPSGVTRIYDYTFNNCTKLALTSLPSGVTAVGDHAFSQCTSLALTSLPSGVTSISNYAFAYCTGITSISCSGTITTLVSYSFTGSSSYPMALTSVSFPNMTVSSLSYAFGSTTAANACQLLAFADIGSTKAIASSSFANCYALQTLVLRRTDAICSLGNVSAFLNTPLRGYNSLTAEVYVPNALISTYQTATNWSTLYNDGTITFKKIEGSDYDLS